MIHILRHFWALPSKNVLLRSMIFKFAAPWIGIQITLTQNGHYLITRHLIKFWPFGGEFLSNFWGDFFNEESINIIAVWESFNNVKIGLGEKMHQFDSFFNKKIDHSSSNRVTAILKTMIMLAVNLCKLLWNQSDQILTLFAF